MFNSLERRCLTTLFCLGLIFTIKSGAWAESQGGLYITSHPPGAQIYLDTDYEPRGITPGLITKLTVGTHSLKLMLSGYATVEEDVAVEADKIKDFSYTLNSQFGNLHISTSPLGAEIWVDGKLKGISPLELDHLLATSHQVHTKLKGYQVWFKQIGVEPGKTEHIKAKLIPLSSSANTSQSPPEECGIRCHGTDAANGQLKVESTPSGAHVWVDDELKGRTPLRLKFFSGDYMVRLSKPGYNKHQQRIQIHPQEQFSLQVKLEFQHGTEDMVYIPAGEFTMGSNKGQPDERPPHKVYLKAFYIDKYEVTNAQYRRFFLSDNRRQPSYPYERSLGRDQQPVVGVSWLDAHKYCKWAGKRLPTEAEWEKSARGSEGLVYPWGNEWQPEYANNAQSGLAKPANVGNYPKSVSPYGVFDMAGNVWEWCNDYYAEDYYTKAPRQNPSGPEQGKLRVLRGGSWFDELATLRTATRRGENPKMRLSNIGFRCAQDPAF